MTLRRQWAPHRPVWIATSTHDGEESIIIAAHQALLNQFPNLFTNSGSQSILNGSWMQLTSYARLGCLYHFCSSGEVPSSGTQVVIGDTMGELMLL